MTHQRVKQRLKSRERAAFNESSKLRRAASAAPLVCLLAAGASGTEIIGHRGASADAPENTLSSFKLGYAQNADAVELDIFLTKDGKIVVIHDPDTVRTAGVSNNVAECTFGELRQLDVGKFGQWKERGFSEKIPSLEEVLAVVPDGKRLFIEIKCGAEVLPELEQVLARAKKRPEQTVIIGFGLETMRLAKRKFPGLQVFWLVSNDPKTRKFPPLEELITQANTANVDGLNLNSKFPMDAAFVRRVHEAGLKLYTWTVDEAKVARAEAEAGVDGITTDRPGWLRQQLPGKP
jgi:glycerophosphoryl diester phosphodiesterase